MAAEAPDRVAMILTRGDLQSVLERRATGEPVLGAVLGSEGGHPLEARSPIWTCSMTPVSG
ncbi:hypothetical protein [Paracoccus tegillarcae]|uniref:hypothetical protein n=1 Tax=Paracoccus tegillarcae TaxID=1529068 RepID=UPI0030CBDA67